NFMRSHGTKTGPFKICNHCSYQKRQSSMSANLTVEDTTQDTIHYPQPENDDNLNLPMESNNEYEGLVYELEDLEELVGAHFRNEEENSHVEFSVVIELRDEYVEEILLNERDSNNISREDFHSIVNTLLISIEAGSRYYW